VAEASRLLARYGDGAAVYAGGTELLPVMKEGLADYRHLVNIKRIPGLDAVEAGDGILSIGALATHKKIEMSPAVRAQLPLLARVASGVANLRVRNVGTIGGNLCFAEPHSDPAVVLLACGATVVLAGDGAERSVPINAFFAGILQTVRRPDEILVRVEVPVFGPGVAGSYHRFALHERPTAGVAAVVDVHRGAITSARLAVGSVGPVAERIPEAEALVVGHPPDSGVLEVAASAAGRSAEVLEDMYGSVEYKRHIVTVLARRALKEAATCRGVVSA
jgi:carbon-monoxide dehydrogenase medium subunit